MWLLPPDGKTAPREAEIERHWLHKGRVVLKFAGVDSISDAALLAGWHVAIPRDQRAPLAEDAFYVADLIGCHLIDEANSCADLGPVLDVARGTGGALDMLVLSRGNEELLIPFAKAYLVQIDLEKRVLRMRLPAGLTTINSPLSAEERAEQQGHPRRTKPAMRFDILTIFPSFFDGFLTHGVVRRALENGIVQCERRDLRDFTTDRHRTVDDRPFGGGEGMVLKPEPLAAAIESLDVRPKPNAIRPRERDFALGAGRALHSVGCTRTGATGACCADLRTL